MMNESKNCKWARDEGNQGEEIVRCQTCGIHQGNTCRAAPTSASGSGEEPAPVEAWHRERKVTIHADAVLRVWGTNIESDMVDFPRTLQTVQDSLDWLYEEPPSQPSPVIGGDERAAFERYARSIECGQTIRGFDRNGHWYHDPELDSHWRVWQARAALSQAAPQSEPVASGWLDRTLHDICKECGIQGIQLARLAHTVGVEREELLFKLTTPIRQMMAQALTDKQIDAICSAWNYQICKGNGSAEAATAARVILAAAQPSEGKS